MKSICIFLATGFEEVEALFPLDILRRGGLSVKTVSVMGEPTVTGAHGVPVVADCLIEDLNEADIEMIVLPGGLPGATNLDAHAGLRGSDGLWKAWFAERKEGYLLSGIRQVPGRSGIYRQYGGNCR